MCHNYELTVEELGLMGEVREWINVVRIAQDRSPLGESRMKGGQFIRNPGAKPVAPLTCFTR